MSKQRIEELEEQIKHHDELYYGKDAPEITDPEYDSLVVELRNLTEGSLKPSVLDKPGKGTSTAGLTQVKHIRPMLSLRTEVDTSIAPIRAFVERVYKDYPGVTIVSEYKYDGLAASLRYENGILVDAVLRGDGEIGESVRFNMDSIQGIETIIDNIFITEIRGEIMMPKSGLEYINQIRIAAGEKPYVNCRNAVAGIVRSKSSHPKALETLVFNPYSSFGDNAIWNQSESLDRLGGFCKIHQYGDNVTYVAEKLYEEYLDMEKNREFLEFDIDGIVFKVDDLSIQMKMGVTGREPRWAIAHKFVPQKALTTLEAIDIQVGQSGRLTPVARLKPVFVGGVTVTNVTLSNIFQIRKKKVRVGDIVEVQRAGDVIPEIAGVASSNVRKGYVKNFRMPDRCPVCRGDVVRDKGTVNSHCLDPDCQAQVTGKFVRIARREIFDIDGLGPAVASQLLAGGIVQTSHLLECDEIDLREAGLGVADSVKLASEFKRILHTPISMKRLIQSLNIPTIGDSASKVLAEKFPTKESFLSMKYEDLSIPGITKLNLKHIIHYFNNYEHIAESLFGLFTIAQEEKVIEGELTGKTIVVTGGFAPWTADDLSELIAKYGGKVGSGVSKSTDLLIHGKGAGSKLAKAINLGIPMMTIEEFVTQYGKNNGIIQT